MVRDTVTAGALVRRQVRAALDVAGLAWREHKGWTASTFAVSGTSGQMRHARRLIAQIDAGAR